MMHVAVALTSDGRWSPDGRRTNTAGLVARLTCPALEEGRFAGRLTQATRFGVQRQGRTMLPQ